MPRDLPIGNGRILVAFDPQFRLREFYFPHVGEENHAGDSFRTGVFAEGRFSWVGEGWRIERDYLGDTLVTDVLMQNDELGLRIGSNDLVDFEEDLYLKKITVENLWDESREIQLFLTQDFHISGNEIGDTAAFKPEVQGMLHYKGERYFLTGLFANHKFGIDSYAAGNNGTWIDCEDGVLSQNPIAQGSVDSAISIPLALPPKGAESCFYWIAVGKNWEEAEATHRLVKRKSPEEIFRRTKDYWTLWASKEKIDEAHLPEKIARLYRRSLLIFRTQMNNCGSIIAANDSDAIRFNRDTYSYMWPRDGALVSYALTLAGYDTAPFFQFIASVIEKEGYLLHKYSPSGSLGSSWHPWLKEQRAQLPIQEDETALVLWALWKHYLQFRDLELIRRLYTTLVKPAADFMMNYRDLQTGLPLPSYDLWEERQGVLTFTVAAVFGGLMAASSFAGMFGEKELAKEYADGAAKMRGALEKYLYLPKEKRFARMAVFPKESPLAIDPTLDASLYGLVAFGVYPADNEKVKSTLSQVFEALEVNGGIIRYENDPYYREEGKPSNPWFVTTLWKAQYLSALAKSAEELKPVLEILEWVADKALQSGVMAEQLRAETLEPVSVSPLTWSHGTCIAAVQDYFSRLSEMEKALPAAYRNNQKGFCCNRKRATRSPDSHAASIVPATSRRIEACSPAK